jgi:methyl-accepting chemotaxis protein
MFFNKSAKIAEDQLSSERTKASGLQSQVAELTAKLAALDKSQAVIEFAMDGTILTANDNFLQAMGYRLDEVQGQHHRIFMDAKEAQSTEYAQFWQQLNRGEFVSAEFKRMGKGHKEIWIQASYNPIFDDSGRPVKVIKFATDITQQKNQSADFKGQIEAIGKSQAVIEFSMDGIIQSANDNFLHALGYSLDEIKGQHHSLFVEPAYKNSDEYRQFWQALNRGEFSSGEYKRMGKGGREIWIQASYNPILDLNGKPVKVVKYASDITQQKIQAADYRGQINAIGKSQAVIEFTPDGNIIQANDNFLNTLGYTLDEVKGKHHSLFVEAAYKNSPAYSRVLEDL